MARSADWHDLVVAFGGCWGGHRDFVEALFGCREFGCRRRTKCCDAQSFRAAAGGLWRVSSDRGNGRSDHVGKWRRRSGYFRAGVPLVQSRPGPTRMASYLEGRRLQRDILEYETV